MTRKDARLIVAVDRDSVAAGDDCESHAAATTVSVTDSVAALLDAAERACPLAGIIGGRATWIVDVGSGDAVAAVAVVAEEWQEPRLLVPPTTTVADLFAARAPAVFFRYWCQADPVAVFEALRDGRPLPSRYG